MGARLPGADSSPHDDRTAERPAKAAGNTSTDYDDRSPQRHGHAPHAGHAQGHVRGRAGRRRLRRRPHRQRPGGARRRAARQGGRPLRRQRLDGQPRLAARPPRHAARRRSPGRAPTWSRTSRPATPSSSAPRSSQMPEKPDGTWDLDELEDAFRDPRDPHEPITGLVALENTHAHSMGQPLTLEYTRAVAAIAHAHGVPLHVDGARFFNATVALGLTPRALAEPADSVAFCLSKGLACPIGSMVVGSRDFIHRAHRGRKLVGGGMRQVGVLAAAGLVALSDGPDGMIERLAEDHANARRLAEGLAALDGIESPGGLAQPTLGRAGPGRAATNFVVFRVRARPGRLPGRSPGPRRPHGRVLARHHPGRDPLRRHRRRTSSGSSRPAPTPSATRRPARGRLRFHQPNQPEPGQPQPQRGSDRWQSSFSRDPCPPPSRARSTAGSGTLVEANFRDLIAEAPDLRHVRRPPRQRRQARRRHARRRGTGDRRCPPPRARDSRRSTRPPCRRACASSASWPSTTSAASCSTWRSTASGSAAPRPWTASATRSSASSPATSRPCPSASVP